MSSAPEWLASLANKAASHLASSEAVAPLGCHYCLMDGVWEITLFASDTEVVGGEKDGERKGSRFVVDVMPVLCLFTEILDCTWQPDRFDEEDEFGSHLAIIGTFSGQLVCLRVLSRSPRHLPPGRRANAFDGTWEELW
jgi:hypothetical protein